VPAAASPVLALSFLFRLVRPIFEVLRVHHLNTIERDVEIIGLRHQVQELQRGMPRPRFTDNRSRHNGVLDGDGALRCVGLALVMIEPTRHSPN
jgi:hypothetical protein